MLGRARSGPLRVADLGAGTGIASRLLAALGHDVVAVEPDEGMRARLRAASPGVTVLAGSAEAIPLERAAVDAAVAAQAFHWFDNDIAKAEIARVVRPGGVFGAIWNVRDDSVPWVAEISRIVGIEDATSATGHGHGYDPEPGPAFADPARVEFRHTVTHTIETLLDLVHSRSRYLVAGERERRSFDDALRALAAGLPERFELAYVAVAFRALRRP